MVPAGILQVNGGQPVFVQLLFIGQAGPEYVRVLESRFKYEHIRRIRVFRIQFIGIDPVIDIFREQGIIRAEADADHVDAIGQHRVGHQQGRAPVVEHTGTKPDQVGTFAGDVIGQRETGIHITLARQILESQDRQIRVCVLNVIIAGILVAYTGKQQQLAVNLPAVFQVERIFRSVIDCRTIHGRECLYILGTVVQICIRSIFHEVNEFVESTPEYECPATIAEETIIVFILGQTETGFHGMITIDPGDIIHDFDHFFVQPVGQVLVLTEHSVIRINLNFRIIRKVGGPGTFFLGPLKTEFVEQIVAENRRHFSHDRSRIIFFQPVTGNTGGQVGTGTVDGFKFLAVDTQ